MTLEAPLSKYKRSNFLIGIIVCVGLALWCGYDGYFSETFKQEHPEWWGVNRAAPFVLLPLAGLLGAWLYAIRGRKLVAGENELVVAGKERIPYDAIERIDKTHFENKGFFIITYKKDGREVDRKLSDHQWDRLAPVLDHLIAKIT